MWDALVSDQTESHDAEPFISLVLEYSGWGFGINMPCTTNSWRNKHHRYFKNSAQRHVSACLGGRARSPNLLAVIAAESTEVFYPRRPLG